MKLESILLFPLKSDDGGVGLLQLVDHHFLQLYQVSRLDGVLHQLHVRQIWFAFGTFQVSILYLLEFEVGTWLFDDHVVEYL